MSCGHYGKYLNADKILKQRKWHGGSLLHPVLKGLSFANLQYHTQPKVPVR